MLVYQSMFDTETDHLNNCIYQNLIVSCWCINIWGGGGGVILLFHHQLQSSSIMLVYQSMFDTETDHLNS